MESFAVRALDREENKNGKVKIAEKLLKRVQHMGGSG
jgi:hypothetical protein